MKLFVGIGNPGREYAKTRHNAGFLFIDELAARWNAPPFARNKKYNAEMTLIGAGRKKIIFLKPATFMNASGEAVAAVARFYKITPQQIIVAHDDKDLPLGTYKIQTNRGPAGHNGVKSIIQHLGTQDFTRLRLGIAPVEPAPDTATFVLGAFTSAELKKLHHTFLELFDRATALATE